jgi:hypothetical protein
MKTRMLKLGFLPLILVIFQGCNKYENRKLAYANSTIEEPKEIIGEFEEMEYFNDLTDPLSEIGNLKQDLKSEHELDKSFLDIGRYDVFGDFSIKEDRLTVFIPVTHNKLNIEDWINISTPDINAILIKISNNSYDSTKEKPITKVIEKVFSIKALGLDTIELSNDKKLKVIILNENSSDISVQKNFYTKCLEGETDYIKKSCQLPRIKSIRPNEDGGDILTGG